jgi:hypothetical protein
MQIIGTKENNSEDEHEDEDDEEDGALRDNSNSQFAVSKENPRSFVSLCVLFCSELSQRQVEVRLAACG